MKLLKILPALFIILSACSPTRSTYYHYWQPWQLSDLKMLSSPNTPDPGTDLIGVYTRLVGDDFQIRLDLLDIQPDFKFDVYILLKTDSTGDLHQFPAAPSSLTPFLPGSHFDLLIKLPLAGITQVFIAGSMQPDPKLSPRLQRDPLNDTVTISLNRNLLPSLTRHFSLQIFITDPGGKVLLDHSPLVSNDAQPPLSAAPLILAFSDSFPALSPAQALRRWDGSHTGPTGERHGLTHILSNASVQNLPVILLDLKTPSSLSALDFIGALPHARDLVKSGLLLLPDVAFASPNDLSLTASRVAAQAFNLPGSLFVFSPDSHLQTGYRYQFVSLPESSHLIRQAGQILIPLPDLSSRDAPAQATNQGLSLEVRKQLLAVALSPDPTDLVALGGSLPHSTWGDSDMANASLGYIAAHPWMQPLNGDQLQLFGSQASSQKFESQTDYLPSVLLYTSQGHPTHFDSNQLQSRLLQDLQTAPRNSITASAWQMFFNLVAPSADLQYYLLKQQYLNQVESMLSASRWAENPTILSDCSLDIDMDTINECVLSNDHMFAIFETDGGRLSYLFERKKDRVHQIIGPQSQFAVGLSDPSTWQPLLGPAGDPAEIPGAFSDADAPFSLYSISSIDGNTLTLARSDGKLTKTYTLTEKGLTLECQSSQVNRLLIPLALEPQKRFLPGWANRYHSLASSDFYMWGLDRAINLEIRTTATLYAKDFTQSRLLLSKPENPNLDYPPGHFLPFPLALVEVNGNGSFLSEILVLP
jgi:hypothetical protein